MLTPITKPTVVTAADTSIVIGGTASSPTVRTNTLDVIAADHPPAANWSNNSHKITSVTDPTSAQDAATKNYVDLAVAAIAASTGYVYGLHLTWNSTTSISVTAGSCRDSADAAFIPVVAGTIIITTNASANGNDSFTGTGTTAISNGGGAAGKTITGTSTKYTQSVANGGFGTRLLPNGGTIGTGGVSSTTLTGSGTNFLLDVAVNDLIGVNAGTVFSRVTAIASKTSLTVSTAFTISNGSTGAVVEQPTISITGDTNSPHQVDSLTLDTAGTVTENSSAAIATASYFIGRPYARAAVQAAQFLFVWAGGSNNIWVSTQRTTPYGVGTSNWRRIGSLTLDSSANIVPFIQADNGSHRTYDFVIALEANNTLILNGGVSTAWADVVANVVVPPTASKLILLFFVDGTAGDNAYIRTRGASYAALTSNYTVQSLVALELSISYYVIPCDSAQAVQYVVAAGTVNAFLVVIGYEEDL